MGVYKRRAEPVDGTSRHQSCIRELQKKVSGRQMKTARMWNIPDKTNTKGRCDTTADKDPGPSEPHEFRRECLDTFSLWRGEFLNGERQ